MKMSRKWMALLPLLAGLAACDDFGPGADVNRTGELRWELDGTVLSKASAEIPDTNDFLLSIRDVQGKVLYEGPYGDSPTALSVTPGSYTVSVVSIDFTSPAFARPQYGDEQVVVVASGQSVTVKLLCTLLNCGIRLHIAPDFLTTYPNGVLYVKQGSVRLMYGYMESRIAYFKPGDVSLILYNEGKDQTLCTRSLQAREVLTLQISAPGNTSGTSSIQVAVDTTKYWMQEQFVIGGGNTGGGSGDAQALSVSQAAAHAGESEVWIYGYIVGGDLSSAGTGVKTSGITKNTHIALAERSSVTVKAQCVAVELPAGKVRDALNLVSHPDLIGSRVYVKGDIVEKYFGTTGLKSTNDFVLK